MTVSLGISDGSYTEIAAGDLNEGDPAIVEAVGNSKKTQAGPGGPGFFR